MCFNKSVSHPIMQRLTCVAGWLPNACNQAFIGSPGANEASHWTMRNIPRSLKTIMSPRSCLRSCDSIAVLLRVFEAAFDFFDCRAKRACRDQCDLVNAIEIPCSMHDKVHRKTRAPSSAQQRINRMAATCRCVSG